MFDYRVPQVWVDYTFLASIPDDFTGQQLVVCLELTVTGGFRLYCDYKFGNWNANTQMCGTYYYRDSIYFYSNGIVKPNVIIYGPGFDDTKVYNVLYRTDHDIASPSPNYFYRWEGVQWTQRPLKGTSSTTSTTVSDTSLGTSGASRMAAAITTISIQGRQMLCRDPDAERTCTLYEPIQESTNPRTTPRPSVDS